MAPSTQEVKLLALTRLGEWRRLRPCSYAQSLLRRARGGNASVLLSNVDGCDSEMESQKWNSKKFWRRKCKLVNSLTPLIPASCRSCHVSRKKSELKKWLLFKPVVVRFAVQVATCCHSSDMFQLGLLAYWGVHCESCIIKLLACQYRGSSCHPTMKSCWLAGTGNGLAKWVWCWNNQRWQPFSRKISASRCSRAFPMTRTGHKYQNVPDFLWIHMKLSMP